MKKKVVRFSVSTAPDLLNEFDQITQNLGYDRSKAIQAAMRNYLSELRLSEGRGQGAGALVMLYDHEATGLEEKLTDIQHGYKQVVSSSMHIHLASDVCLEIIAVKGDLKTIHELAQKIMVQRGVMQMRLVAVNP